MRYGRVAVRLDLPAPVDRRFGSRPQLVAAQGAFEEELLEDVAARSEVGPGSAVRRLGPGDRTDDGRGRDRVGHQGMVEPPLGRITMPVTNLAAGDAR